MSLYGNTNPTSQGSSSSSDTFVTKITSVDGPAVGIAISIPSVAIAQLAGQADGDFIMIDMEHAPMPMEVVTQMVHAYIQSTRGAKFPLVRIPSHGVEWVKWALDSGAAGIIVPMVNNAREMEVILDRAIYPPGGRRSFGALYANFANPDDLRAGAMSYFERAKRGDIAVLPMIESQEGLANVEEIMALDGVSGVFIGPSDLRLSLGLSAAADGPESVFLDALKKICVVGKKFNKVVGCMGMGEDHAAKRATQGMDFILSASDYGAVVAGFANDVAAARKGVQSVAKL